MPFSAEAFLAAAAARAHSHLALATRVLVEFLPSAGLNLGAIAAAEGRAAAAVARVLAVRAFVGLGGAGGKLDPAIFAGLGAHSDYLQLSGDRLQPLGRKLVRATRTCIRNAKRKQKPCACGPLLKEGADCHGRPWAERGHTQGCMRSP